MVAITAFARYKCVKATAAKVYEYRNNSRKVLFYSFANFLQSCFEATGRIPMPLGISLRCGTILGHSLASLVTSEAQCNAASGVRGLRAQPLGAFYSIFVA